MHQTLGCEFLAYAKAVAFANGDLHSFLRSAPVLPIRTAMMLRAAAAAGSSLNPTWAAELVEYRLSEGSFIESLRSDGVFNRLLAGPLRRVPMNALVVLTTSISIASTVAELSPKPVNAMHFTGNDLERAKCALIVVLSRELVRLDTDQGDDLINRELQAGVIAATDKAFLSILQNGVVPIPSYGTDAAAVATDIGALLAAMDTGQASRIFLIVSPTTAKSLMTMTGTDGRPAFEIGLDGGVICNVPTMVSGQIADNVAMLIDASRVMAAADPIMLASSTYGSLEMNTAPDGTLPLVSLWQSNLFGLLTERTIGVRPLGSCVSMLSGVAWGAP